MAQPARPPPDQTTPYFAYGSNLSLPQMARRCPASVFGGAAVLRGYRWQITRRGVANMVRADDDDDDDDDGGESHRVHGLLYGVPPADEAALDRFEGVAAGAYQKHRLPVRLAPHPRYAGWRADAVAADLARDDGLGHGHERPSDPETPGTPEPVESTTALVYVSETYTADGRIRDEYGPRMQTAVHYARALGVPKDYVDSVIVPCL